MTCSGIAVRISPCHPRAEEHSIDLKQSPQSDTMSTIVLAEIRIEICAFRWWSREESRRPSQYLAFRQSSKFPQNYDLLWVVYSRCSSPAQTGDEQQRCNFVWLKTKCMILLKTNHLTCLSIHRSIRWSEKKKTSSIVANLISHLDGNTQITSKSKFSTMHPGTLLYLATGRRTVCHTLWDIKSSVLQTLHNLQKAKVLESPLYLPQLYHIHTQIQCIPFALILVRVKANKTVRPVGT